MRVGLLLAAAAASEAEGPVVVHPDGSHGRVTNWAALSPTEREARRAQAVLHACLRAGRR